MQTAQEKATWISETTWRLADQRTAMRRRHMTGQRELRASTRIFQEAPKEEMRPRVSKAGAYIEALVEADHTRKSYINIQRWD